MDAERWLAGQETDQARGQWIDPATARTTLDYWAERWLATTIHLRPKTRSGYESVLRVHVLPHFGEMAVSMIDTPAVRAFVAGMSAAGHAPGTIAGARKVLRLVLATARDAKAIPANPCDGVKVSRGAKTEMHFLDHAQVEALAIAISRPEGRCAGYGAAPWWRTALPEYGALVLFASYSGLRAGEIAGLRVRRLNLLARRVEVAETLTEVQGHGLVRGTTKTGKVRTVPLPPFVCDELAPLLAGKGPDDYVFTSPDGAPLRHHNFYARHFRPAVRQAGLTPELRFHDLRHTYASFLIASGAHPKAIMERLGHSSITVTLNLTVTCCPAWKST